MRTYNRAVEILPLVDLPSGTAEPVKLSCGHILNLNPTMLHKVGDLNRCRECEPHRPCGWCDQPVNVADWPEDRTPYCCDAHARLDRYESVGAI